MAEGSIAIVTGSLGLVGSAAVRRFDQLGLSVIGVDNDLRSYFFGKKSSNAATLPALEKSCRDYRHTDLDIRDHSSVEDLVKAAGKSLAVIVHAAAQPSHDWAATDPMTDFAVNATATLALLESCRRHAAHAPFLFVSTNKVYGDLPNELPLVECNTRLELRKDHRFHAHGIDESMPIDRSRHSLFGVSKAAADLMVQEYASRFGLLTVAFRAGCITGQDHHAAKVHGFLAYLCDTARSDGTYEVIGHGGKQVRDNLHADDLADAFAQVVEHGSTSGVYNIGGGRDASCSVIEALDWVDEILERRIRRIETPVPRYGDHAWWISDTSRFRNDYPGWRPRHSARELIEILLA